jgi:hypothetical protein
MSCAVTAKEIDELEELLIKYHNNHAGESNLLNNCTHTTCVNAKLGIAWLREQLRLDDVMKAGKQTG